MFSYCNNCSWYCSIIFMDWFTPSIAAMVFCFMLAISNTAMPPLCAGDTARTDSRAILATQARLIPHGFLSTLPSPFSRFVVERLIGPGEHHVLGDRNIEPVSGPDFKRWR